MTGFDLGQLIHITDARAPNLSEIEMWRVTGIEGLYPTKIAAEKAARVTRRPLPNLRRMSSRTHHRQVNLLEFARTCEFMRTPCPQSDLPLRGLPCRPRKQLGLPSSRPTL